ncbi:IclR family transcriptional regulator [Microbacterium oryzae]|uniref:IclR family transcriptional regulator n=1 Tax=Microbacterium oryzae TaxID=743009 RepID=UPI0025B0FC55|nr:IclR family transcriptional regulator [Microbacterium oryzae]MDN3310223.1 IclR family transcriptional regulator [Microbacterium oryzae]
MANSTSGDSVTDRLVRVLETFTPTRTVQTTAEIGRRAGLPSSSAHRIVGELVEAGLLERDDQRRVRIGMRLWELATRSSHALRLRQVALPFMERVQARVREHTQLAILEQDEALFLERLSDADSGANITRVAGRLPLHASSSGLVLLSYADRDLQERVLSAPLQRLTDATLVAPTDVRRKLSEIRLVGYAVAPGYIETVSTGVAVPVREGSGVVIAALSVVLPRGTAPESALPELRHAAAGIENALVRHR